MLESLVNPKRVEKGSWKMFFIGLLYGSLSLLLVHWFFSRDAVLSKFSGMIVVLFCVMFSLPFIYYVIKKEEKQDEQIEGVLHVWKAHSDAIFAFMWLFLGFLIAFSFWYILLQNTSLFNAQLETYCMINSPGGIENCVAKYSDIQGMMSGASTSVVNFLSIIENNIYVMIFTLLLSLIFGAGAIFVLAWNASVIASAIGVFTRYHLAQVPIGLLRYMIHGVPEIAAYFVTALAGGILGTGIIRHGIKDKRFLHIIENVTILLFISLALLVIAGLMEVYLTPLFFK
ncbi:MAG: stage II sporulation protein M [Nanoarchaeota archaeon]|nr:stage II sporulation protein M [Nanoarchaeota archaeon]